MDKNNIKILLTKKNEINQENIILKNIIKKNISELQNIQNKLWNVCDHEFERDNILCYGESTKLVCKICGCYKNHYWYQNKNI